MRQGLARRLHMGCGESLRTLLPAPEGKQVKNADQGRDRPATKHGFHPLEREGEQR
jgi:hypothetical protein